MTQLILGTTSKGRKDLFSQLGIDFIASDSNVEEYFKGRPTNPQSLCLHLAKLKAKTVAKKFNEGLVLGFDTVALFDNEIIEKPQSKEEQYQRFKKFSGNQLTVYTGVYLIDIKNNRTLSQVIATDAQIRDLTETEINKYLDTNPNYNKFTIGFDPLNSLASTFTKSINGSYQNYIRGIPLETVIEMLYKFNFKL